MKNVLAEALDLVSSGLYTPRQAAAKVGRAHPRPLRTSPWTQEWLRGAVEKHRNREYENVIPVREWLERLWKKKQCETWRQAVPEVKGAGSGLCYIETGEWGARTGRGYSKNKVAHSYRYPVWDYYFTLTMPRTGIIRKIDGLWTGYDLYDYEATDGARVEPVASWVVKQGRGYEVKLVKTWLYHSRHYSISLDPSKVVLKYKSERRKQAESRLKAMTDRRKVRDVWIDREALVKIGACGPGLDAAIVKVKELLGATGEIGAVRLSTLMQMGGEFERWGLRAAGVGH